MLIVLGLQRHYALSGIVELAAHPTKIADAVPRSATIYVIYLLIAIWIVNERGRN